jgi:uncharacterized protein YkwD
MSALDVLNGLNGEIQVGLVIGETVIPIIVGAVKDVKAWLGASGTIEFTVAITQGQSELESSVSDFTTVIQEINAERAKANPPLPPISIPSGS